MRLLVIKHGALGDIIQGVDGFASLRAHFPKAQITVLTSPAFAELMRAMPYFDEVIIDKRAPFYDLKAFLDLRHLFRSAFDIIIDMQCSKRTASYHRTFAPKGQRWLGTAKNCSDPYPDFTNVNNRDRMVHAALMLGGKPVTGDLAFLANGDVLPNIASISQPYAVLMPGCSAAKPSKKWPALHYAALADLCVANGITPLLIGTSVDEADCELIAQACQGAVNLCGKTSLADLASLCARAVFCVGNDSGPVFLAAKTAANTLMLMGPDTDPSMSAPKGKRASYIKADNLARLTAAEVFEKITSSK